MKPLILIDLDDTLLKNDMDSFLPVYLGKLGKQLDGISSEIIARELIRGTHKMVEKIAPAQTLEQVFDRHFYPAIGASKAQLNEKITAFYTDIFPEVRCVTEQKPDAIVLMNDLRELDYPVVIATNPLFPHQAAIERLKWAGIPSSEYSYRLITSYETFHFSKPNPAYFLEILAQLGWQYQTAVMIGNDIDNDIRAASNAGLACYRVTDEQDASLPEDIQPFSSLGTLSGILPWLEKLDRDGYETRFDSISSILASLKSTPAALDTICSSLPETQWKKKPAEDKWCATEILCHLRDVDKEVNLPRLDSLSEFENQFIAGKSTDSWAKERNYFEQDGPAALADFIDIRSTIIEKLSHLSNQDWNKKARHAIFGPTTLKELVGFIATHDRVHIQQIINSIN